MAGEDKANLKAAAPRHTTGFMPRALGAAGLAIAVILLLLLLWYAVDVLLLICAGILLAILLRGLSDWLSTRTALSRGWSLAIIMVTLVGILGLSAWLLAPHVAAQVNQLFQELPRALRQVEERLERYAWGRQLLARAPHADALQLTRHTVLSRATGLFSTTLGDHGARPSGRGEA